jgi:hypothetical protein
MGIEALRCLGIALAVAAPLLSGRSSAYAGSYFVSAEGNDANPGTLERPFATLQRAPRAARQAQRREPVTIYLRGGTHYLTDTLILTAEDSGTPSAPVVFQAYRNEQAVISGGVRLKDLKWEPLRDAIRKTVVPAGLTTDQLFVNGQRQPMARYPNFDPDQRIFNGYAADAFSPQRAKRWADPRGGFIHALHGSEWGGFHFVITGKKEDGTVTFEGGWQNNRPSPMHGQFRFVENIFEELDAPGEWFLDAKAGLQKQKSIRATLRELFLDDVARVKDFTAR